MAFSYSSTLASDKDKVRALIGDIAQINSENLLEDEEIEGWLQEYNNDISKAAAFCMRTISSNSAKLQILKDRTAGAMTESDWSRELDRKALELIG